MFIKKSKRIDQFFVPVAEIHPNPTKTAITCPWSWMSCRECPTRRYSLWYRLSFLLLDYHRWLDQPTWTLRCKEECVWVSVATARLDSAFWVIFYSSLLKSQASKYDSKRLRAAWAAFFYQKRKYPYCTTSTQPEEPSLLFWLPSGIILATPTLPPSQTGHDSSYGPVIVCVSYRLAATRAARKGNLSFLTGRSPSKTRPPITTFPSPVISSFGSNSCSSRLALGWIGSASQ